MGRALLGHLRTLIRPRRTILFYPQAPWFPHLIFKQCAVLGYLLTTDPEHTHDVAFKWKGATFFDSTELEAIPEESHAIINARSTDISKHRVAAVFEAVFGYALEVDPTSYVGPMVEKSDLNAHHDGRIVEGPLPPGAAKPGTVYQRLIDTRTPDGEHVVDHRIPLYGGRVPLVYVKRRDVRTRFSNWNKQVQIHRPESVMSPDELSRLGRFAEVMGIDYGELDVLRDRDGRIYIVDANNTPAGPPNGLTPEQRVEATSLLAGALDAFLDEWTHRRPEPAEETA